MITTCQLWFCSPYLVADRAALTGRPVTHANGTWLPATGPAMQIDDTPEKCQGGRGQKNFQAYLWTFVNPEVSGVAYRFTVGRAGDLITAQLSDFAGWLVGDGYSDNKDASKKVAANIKIGGDRRGARLLQGAEDRTIADPGTL